MWLTDEEVKFLIRAIEIARSEIIHELDYYNPPQERRKELQEFKWELNKLEYKITSIE